MSLYSEADTLPADVPDTEYWVAFDLPTHILKEIERVRVLLAHQLGLYRSSAPPHITIKTPFTRARLVGRRQRIPVRSVLDKIHADGVLKKTEMRFGPLKSFDNPHDQVIYLSVESEGLYRAARYVIEQYRIFGITPTEWDGKTLHTTVVRHLNEDSFGAAWEMASHARLPRDPFTVESFTLYREVDGKSVPIQSYKLA